MDTVYLSTNEIEDLVSLIACRLKLLFPLTGVVRLTYLRPPTCVMIVANAVAASVALVVASFFLLMQSFGQ